MHDYAKKMKLLEINPRSPLIEGLLKRVEQLPAEEEERDLEAEDELREVAAVLIDGALVRSGFGVTDSNECVPLLLHACPTAYTDRGRATDSFPVSTASCVARSVSPRRQRRTRP